MKIRNLIFAAASAALVATPIAAQANTRAAGSSVAVSPAAFSGRQASNVAGQKFAGGDGIILPLALIGMGGLLWALIEATEGNKSPGAND